VRRSTLPVVVGVLAGLALARPMAGQQADADTTEVRPSEPIPLDSLPTGLAPSDTIPVLAPRFRGAGVAELAAVPTQDSLPRNPRNAAIRAFLIPGWGQVYTGHPWRAALFAAAEVGFGWAGYSKQRDALAYQADLRAAQRAFFADPPEGIPPDDSTALEQAFEQTAEATTLRSQLGSAQGRREDFYAYTALSVIFAAVDAYVAAQLDPLRVERETATGRVRAWLRLAIGPGARAGPVHAAAP